MDHLQGEFCLFALLDDENGKYVQFWSGSNFICHKTLLEPRKFRKSFKFVQTVRFKYRNCWQGFLQNVRPIVRLETP